MHERSGSGGGVADPEAQVREGRKRVSGVRARTEAAQAGPMTGDIATATLAEVRRHSGVTSASIAGPIIGPGDVTAAGPRGFDAMRSRTGREALAGIFPEAKPDAMPAGRGARAAEPEAVRAEIRR
ncbi:MAG: hypothetical protein N2422_11425 [Rhodobacteraceae bacterium]|nr:hypothetical protein [Paracoccaceae bacterium]